MDTKTPKTPKTPNQIRIEWLRNLLAAAEAMEKEEQRKVRERQQKAWNELEADPNSWEWTAEPYTYKTFGSGTEIPGLRISRRVKPHILAKWRAGGHPTFSNDAMDGNWMGMFYYRTDEGILTHKGGGHCVLNDPKLCSNDEWNQMNAGIIPDKFKI